MKLIEKIMFFRSLFFVKLLIDVKNVADAKVWCSKRCIRKWYKIDIGDHSYISACEPNLIVVTYKLKTNIKNNLHNWKC